MWKAGLTEMHAWCRSVNVRCFDVWWCPAREVLAVVSVCKTCCGVNEWKFVVA